jgi:hypothetical protein
VQRSKINNNDEVVGWAIYRLDMYRCSDLLGQLVLKASEGDMSLQLQCILQFVPVIGSRELEGKVAEGETGFGGDQ